MSRRHFGRAVGTVLRHSVCHAICVGVACSVLVLVASVLTGLTTFNAVKFHFLPRACAGADVTAALTVMTAKACDRLNEAGVDYWLMDGTLLGAIRNGGRVLRTDHDGDIGYFWSDHAKVAHAMDRCFIVRAEHVGRGVAVDLKRYAVRDDAIVRVNAPHETQNMSAAESELWVPLVTWYNSGFNVSDFLPVRTLGGHGPLRHCKVPAKAEKILDEMFAPFSLAKCEPVEPIVSYRVERQVCSLDPRLCERGDRGGVVNAHDDRVLCSDVPK